MLTRNIFIVLLSVIINYITTELYKQYSENFVIVLLRVIENKAALLLLFSASELMTFGVENCSNSQFSTI